VSGRARLAAGSRRAVSLWVALWSWGLYALRWLVLALPRVDAINLLLPSERRRRVRTELIERAVERGLELQRRVDTIDRSTFLVDARAAPTRRLLPPAATGGGAARDAAWQESNSARRAPRRWASAMWWRFADGRRSFALRATQSDA